MENTVTYLQAVNITVARINTTFQAFMRAFQMVTRGGIEPVQLAHVPL